MHAYMRCPGRWVAADLAAVVGPVNDTRRNPASVLWSVAIDGMDGR